ncbi:hypothetical protein NEMIN01_1795 [Nematocida minor]|uniref:uncharacterized protein n=1 Tax=Nematocida minor TaxID=1912983 RepID=UPI00221FAB28|nr:uncharacterized protein NEMIN01_1795 [Nematocida minor]KAI5192047.1 hypothetical protein NEMIN01_1795 [Nematocida minor]
MARREVKLKIDMEGVLNACKSIDKNYIEGIGDMYDFDNLLRFLKKLKVILSDNIKIESEYSEEENKAVLDIIINDICQYLIDTQYGLETIRGLCFALKNNNDKMSKNMIVIISNELIKPNSLIYRPEHGINMQFDKDKPLENIDPDDENADLSTRTYTLEIDSTGFSSMESFLQASAVRVDIYNLYYFSALADLKSMDDFEVSLIEKHYSLSDLYTKTYKNTDVLLIDYGTRLVYEKQKEIEELNKLIKEMERTSDDKKKNDLILQIHKLFSREDLGIIYSIRNNLEVVRYEKSVQINAINMVEYMINNNILLEEKDGEKVLNIGTNLYDFYKNFRNSRMYFRELSEKKENKLEKEKELCLQELKDKKALYSQLKEEETEEMERVKCAINTIENEIYLLECDGKKEYIGNYIFGCMFQNSEDFSDNLYPEQIKYIFKKIKAFANAQKIKTGETVKLHKRNEELKGLKEKETKELEKKKEKAEAEPKSLFKRLISENGKFAAIFTGTVALGVATAATLNNHYSNESAQNSSSSDFKAARPGKLKND